MTTPYTCRTCNAENVGAAAEYLERGAWTCSACGAAQSAPTRKPSESWLMGRCQALERERPDVTNPYERLLIAKGQWDEQERLEAERAPDPRDKPHEAEPEPGREYVVHTHTMKGPNGSRYVTEYRDPHTGKLLHAQSGPIQADPLAAYKLEVARKIAVEANAWRHSPDARDALSILVHVLDLSAEFDAACAEVRP